MIDTEEYGVPLSIVQRSKTASRIAKAVLSFQDQLLEADSNTGSLCQVGFGCVCGCAPYLILPGAKLGRMHVIA
jgi:hypothetical protein